MTATGMENLNAADALFLIDGAVTMTGSPNFNQRSFEQDDEVAIVALDASLTQQLVEDFEADRELSEAFDPTRWKERSLVTRCKAWFARQIRGQL